MTQSKLPARWRLITLGEIAREKPNNGIFRTNPEYLTNGLGGLPVVWVEELFRGNAIDTEDSRRITATKAEIEKYGLKKGDVLFCRSSLKLDGIAFNNVYLGEDNAALFECHLIRISPKLEDVSPVFLNWFLRSPQIRAVAKSKSKTATMTTIDQQSLASIPIVLPPLAEQRRIAEVLDRAEALRTKRRAALALLDSLTQSLFLDLFGDPIRNPKGWDKLPFESQIESVRYGTGSPPDYVDDGIPFIRATNIKGGAVLTKDLKRISWADAKRISKCQVSVGDLIVVRSGVNTGDAAVVPEELDGAYAAYDLIVRLNEMSAVFYNCLINSSQGKIMLSRLTRRAAQAHLNADQLRKIEFIAPPTGLRKEFARRVGAVEKLKAAQRASLVELDTLFASLRHRAFRGEL